MQVPHERGDPSLTRGSGKGICRRQSEPCFCSDARFSFPEALAVVTVATSGRRGGKILKELSHNVFSAGRQRRKTRQMEWHVHYDTRVVVPFLL
jgi:hypothetical protein